MTSNDPDRVRLCVFAALALLASAPMSAAQDKAALSISLSSPTVRPGETLVVTVTSPANVRFDVVGVLWQGGLVPTTTLPATVPIHIPEDQRPGKYAISAMGKAASSDLVTVVAVVDVELTEVPTKLSTQLQTIQFMWLGEQHPFDIRAELPGGQVVNVTQSSRLTYTSSNPRVARVEDTGMISAVSAGSASVTATYTDGNASRRVGIAVTVPPPPFSVSALPLDFGDVAIHSRVSRNISLKNTTDRPLEIPSVAIGYEEVFAMSNTCTSSSPLAIGASCTITVTFTPPEAARLLTLVWLETADSRFGLTVMGTGVSR